MDTINIMGNTHPTSMPDCKLSPAACVTTPTILGPIEPPKSPAMASRANIAVPPRGILRDEMLMVPGHMMPTEKFTGARANHQNNGNPEHRNLKQLADAQPIPIVCKAFYRACCKIIYIVKWDQRPYARQNTPVLYAEYRKEYGGK